LGCGNTETHFFLLKVPLKKIRTLPTFINVVELKISQGHSLTVSKAEKKGASLSSSLNFYSGDTSSDVELGPSTLVARAKLKRTPRRVHQSLDFVWATIRS